MARAFCKSIAETYYDLGGNYRQDFNVSYVGADVPGNLQHATISVSFDDPTSFATIQSRIFTNVRAAATARGFTVGANQAVIFNMLVG